MNKQGDKAILWTRSYGREGFTLNTITGCDQVCAWKMPDGSKAECYAKKVAEGIAVNSYPGGFGKFLFHPERLESPLKVKKPAGIFLGSMTDMFSSKVEVDWIKKSLEMVKKAHWHIFMVLTKNAPRLRKFADDMPDNLWVGVSMPPSSMYGKALSETQQEKYIKAALKVQSGLTVPVRWWSFEPLSFDVSPILREWIAEHGSLPFEWAVIGAATKGKIVYQPKAAWVRDLVKLLDEQGVAVFFKGNLKGNDGVGEWREEFPKVKAEKVVEKVAPLLLLPAVIATQPDIEEKRPSFEEYMKLLKAKIDKKTEDYPDNPNDFYETPEPLWYAAIKSTKLCTPPSKILDAATGRGTGGRMARRLYPDAKITGVELDDHWFKQDSAYDIWYGGQDFLKWQPNEKFDLIISNPPYSNPERDIAEKFILRARGLLAPGGRAIFIVRTAFLNADRRLKNIFIPYRPEQIMAIVPRPSFYYEMFGVKGTNSHEFSLMTWGEDGAKSCEAGWLPWAYDCHIQPSLFELEEVAA